ncbi:hypothetical protein DFH29DRAFT_1067379 [Suillus ampliporus]|nr:hypothetical protein DFH29DRAFT_1067379 [Suillus ampliporus]
MHVLDSMARLEVTGEVEAVSSSITAVVVVLAAAVAAVVQHFHDAQAKVVKQLLTNQLHKLSVTHNMTSATSSGHPAGAGRKDTSAYNQVGDMGHVTDIEASHLANLIGQKNKTVDTEDCAAVIKENLLWAEWNTARAQLRISQMFIEIPSDDEDFLDEPESAPSIPFAQTAVGRRMMKAAAFLSTLSPMTRKLMSTLAGDMTSNEALVQAVAEMSSATAAEVKVFTSANTIMATGTDNLFEIPCLLLNLAKAKVHGPSCVKLKKGLVLEDPKLCVMDTSNGFPPEASLTANVFYKALSNFLKLLALIADDVMVKQFEDHHQFCMSRDAYMSNFQAVLNFDIKTWRCFFNMSVFLDASTYKERWSEVKIDSHLDCDRGGSGNGGGRYNTYPPQTRQCTWCRLVE